MGREQSEATGLSVGGCGDGACGGRDGAGGDRPDSMYGSGVRDEIYSLKGGDLVNGPGDDDRLVGGRGDDAVNGADGEDIMTGNPGNARLNGGAVYRVEAVDGIRDSISCGNGPRDVVVFDSGLDRSNNCEIRKPR